MLLIILKGRQREIGGDGDKLQTKGIVLIICPSAMSGATMAPRIAAAEIRAPLRKRKRGRKKKEKKENGEGREEKERGKTSGEWGCD